MKKLVIITADKNDADYLTNIEPVTEAQEKFLRKISKILKKHNGEWGDVDEVKQLYPELTEKEIDKLDDLIPFDSENGYDCHTIENIRILTVERDESLL